MAGAVRQAESHLEDPPLPRGETGQDAVQFFFQQAEAGPVGGVLGVLVFDEIADPHIPIVAHRGVQGDGLAGHPQEGVDARDRQPHFPGEIVGGGFPAEILGELPLRPPKPGHDLDHVRGDANGAGLIGNGAGDGLANPPDRVSRELVAAAVIEFLHPFHQPNVSLLDEVQEGLAAVDVRFFAAETTRRRLASAMCDLAWWAASAACFKFWKTRANSSCGRRTRRSRAGILAIR